MYTTLNINVDSGSARLWRFLCELVDLLGLDQIRGGVMWKANSPASLILHHHFDTCTCVEAICLAHTGSMHMLPVAKEIQGVRD